MAEKKRFADFANKHVPLAGKKLKITDVFDREIEILGYRVSASKYDKHGPCLQLQFVLAQELCVLFSGSAVLLEQVEAYKGEMPFVTTIKQIGKFYTFT